MTTGVGPDSARLVVPICVAALVAGAVLVLATEARRTSGSISATGGPPPASALHDRGAATLDARPDACPVWSATGFSRARHR